MDISVTQKQEGFWVKMSNRKRDSRNGEKKRSYRADHGPNT